MRRDAMDASKAELTAPFLFDRASQEIVEERLRDTGILEPCEAGSRAVQREVVASVSAAGVRPLDVATQVDQRLLHDINHETQELVRLDERLEDLRTQEDARQDEWARLDKGMTTLKRVLALLAQLGVTLCALVAALQLLPVTLAELIFIEVGGTFRKAMPMATGAAWALVGGLLLPLALGMMLVGGRVPGWLKLLSIFGGDVIFCAALAMMRLQLTGEEHRWTAYALGALEFAIAFTHGSVTWVVAQWTEQQLRQAEAKAAANALLESTRQAIGRAERLRAQAQQRLDALLSLLARREDEPYRHKMQAELAEATAQSVYLSLVERNRLAAMGDEAPSGPLALPRAELPSSAPAPTASAPASPWWRRLLGSSTPKEAPRLAPAQTP